jgi:hypothetical protein
MKGMSEIRRLLSLQQQQQSSNSHHPQHHSLHHTSTSATSSCNDSTVADKNNDFESVISMNCKCRRIPFLAMVLALCLCFFMGNFSLSVQLTSHHNHLIGGIDDLNQIHFPTTVIKPTRMARMIKFDPTVAQSTASTTVFAKIEQESNEKQSMQLHEQPQQSTTNSLTSAMSSNAVGAISTFWITYLFGRAKDITTAKTIRTGRRQREGTSAENTSTRKQRSRVERKTPRAKKQARRKKSTTPIEPIAASLAPDASFAACLVIKDDNDILSEWIAYHYHTIKMRYLVVAIDPLSSESPNSILDLWSNMTDLQIQIWNDADFMPTQFLQTQLPPPEYLQTVNDLTNIADSNDENLQDKNVMLEISNHRYRQRIFLNSCMKHVRDVDRTWVMHIDTDEYIVPSKLLRQMNTSFVTIPNIQQSGSVLKFIQEITNKAGNLVNYPCISMLRVLFGSMESSMGDIMENIPSDIFDPTQFETLRWRYHGLLNNTTLHGNPKVILDVAAIPQQYFDHPQEPVYSIHRPVTEYCPKNTELTFSNYRKQPLAVNHYLGSWERYNGRNDKRRSKSVYDSKTKLAKRAKDDATRLWLSGFVDNVGVDTAKILLRRYQWKKDENNDIGGLAPR